VVETLGPDDPVIEDVASKLHSRYAIAARANGYFKYTSPWSTMSASYRSAVKAAVKYLIKDGTLYIDNALEGSASKILSVTQELQVQLDKSHADIVESVKKLENTVRGELESQKRGS